MQRDTIEFFGAMRRHGRQNTHPGPKSSHGIKFDTLTKQDKEGKTVRLRPPAMADLMLFSLLCTFRNRETGITWLSKRGAAERLCLSPSTVSESWKWLEHMGLVYKHDTAPIVRKMVRDGRGHYCNLYTVFDLPGRRWSVKTEMHYSLDRSPEPSLEEDEEFRRQQHDLEDQGQRRLA